MPGEPALNTETRLGNRMFYVAARADADGNIPVKAAYTVRRREVKGETDKGLKEDMDQFLKPDPLAPADGKHLKLLDGKKLPDDPMAKAHQLYELVDDMLRYSKEGTEWGRGDVNWVCDSKYGNCTDFHSLFIALARSQKIPARFEIGFGIPEKRGSGDVAGYHCWAKFKPRGQGLGSGGHFRGQQEPQAQGLLLRQPDAGPDHVLDRAATSSSLQSRTGRRSTSSSTPTSRWTASRTRPTR